MTALNIIVIVNYPSKSPPHLPPLSKVRCCRPKKFGRLPEGLLYTHQPLHSNDDILFRINKETAGHIINPAASELFCYDSDNHGKALINGYHWKLTFMQNERIIDIIEGTNGEDNRRYNQIKSVIEFAERFIPYDLGSAYMCIN